MNNHQIVRTIQESAELLNVNLESDTLASVDQMYRHYENDELVEFTRDLVEASSDAGMILLEKHLVEMRFKEFMKTYESPIIVFARDEELAPILIDKKRKKY